MPRSGNLNFNVRWLLVLQNLLIQSNASLERKDLSCLDAQATAGVADGVGVDSGREGTVGPVSVVYGQGS
jgi:hypothetical protein